MARVCAKPGCPEIAVDGTHCFTHRRDEQARKRTQRSEAGKRAQAWYTSRAWQERRLRQLRKHPYCQCPMHEGQRVEATIADHVEPHRGDPTKFWRGKLMSLSQHCHSSWKQRQEKQSSQAEG